MKIFASLFLAGLLTGCAATNATEMIKAAAQDPATVKMTMTTPWGTVQYERNNPK